MARNADRIRKHIRAENGGRKLHVPYAQGTGWALPRTTVIRREVLAEILADNPTVTVSQILMTYDNSDRTPGGWLRHQLKQRLEAEGRPVSDAPLIRNRCFTKTSPYLSGTHPRLGIETSGRTHACFRAEAPGSILWDVGAPAGPEKGSAP